MSAELLRKASALMRERAEAATEGPWTLWLDPSGNDKAAVETTWTRGDPEDGGNLVTDWCETPDAQHIASWHPAVALAVADWLDAQAQKCEEIEAFDRAYGDEPDEGILAARANDVAPALTVARAYLGGDA